MRNYTATEREGQLIANLDAADAAHRAALRQCASAGGGDDTNEMRQWRVARLALLDFLVSCGYTDGTEAKHLRELLGRD